MLERYRPEINLLKWYDKTILGILGGLVLISLYVYSCTCSLGNEKVVIVEPFFVVIKTLDYLVVLMILSGLIIRNGKVFQFQYVFGLILLTSVGIVSLLSYFPCTAKNITNYSQLKYSLLCPKYSIISWANLFWFGIIGIANITLSLFMRTK